MKVAEAIDPPRIEQVTAERLRERYLDDVFAYISRRLPTREDAEDATAETFQVALSELKRVRGADPKLWLFGIARRKVADSLRKRSRRREQALTDHPTNPTAHNLTEQQEAAMAIRRIVFALPEDQREALLLHHLEGLAIKEIAVVMGRSQAAVNSLLQRARARAYREGKEFFVENVS